MAYKKYDEDRYNKLILKYSSKYGIPKFLVKGQMKQESRFNPKAISSAQCKGLMQLSKPVIAEYKIINPYNPDENTEGGCRRLKRSYNIYKKEKGIERWKYALGGYNGGDGYIIEAQKEAVRNNCPDDKWCYVSVFLKDIKYKGKRPDWKQIVEYVDKVIYNMFDYMIMDFAKKVDCDKFNLGNILNG